MDDAPPDAANAASFGPARAAARIRRYVSPAVEIARHPWPFVAEVFREFMHNHGLLLAGAVAYYMLLSIVPLLILLVVALSHVLDPSMLLATLSRYLELVVPGQSGPIVDDIATFLRHRFEVSGVVVVEVIVARLDSGGSTKLTLLLESSDDRENWKQVGSDLILTETGVASRTFEGVIARFVRLKTSAERSSVRPLPRFRRQP